MHRLIVFSYLINKYHSLYLERERESSQILRESSHKNLGHEGSSSSQGDVVVMYANSKNNSGGSSWNKGNGKKERPFCTNCNMSGHTIEKCYKLHGYPLGYKPKGKNNASANQVSSQLSNEAESFTSGRNLCPISKAQCEQLLAFLSSGSGYASRGDGSHHVANVRASSSMAGVKGHYGGTFDVFSSQSQVNSSANLCTDLMSSTSNFPFSPNLSHSIFSTKNVNRDALGILIRS